MKKMELKLPIEDEKSKRKAFKVVSGILGVDSVAVEENKLTIVGNADPVFVAAKLRKIGFRYTQLETVGPAKEDKKEDEKEENNPEPTRVVYVHGPYEHDVLSDENPNGCTIC